MNTHDSAKWRLLILMMVLAVAGATQAAPFFPLHVGQVLGFNRHDTNNPTGWSMTLEITDQATFDTVDYWHVQTWNYENDGQTEDNGYVRSTETGLYAYNPSGDDIAVFRKASVGTKWSLPNDEHGYNYEVKEIVAIESVTVPYGTFDEAYKHRSYHCNDPDNLGLGKSPDWYEWVVPGMGIVKVEDYWCDYPPAIEELVSVFLAPVYRFCSPVSGGHFYTMSLTERDKLIDSYSHVWTYEGVAYYSCSDDTDPSATPVYRFWSTKSQAHVYTNSEAEKTKLVNNYSHVLTYEGPVFYAYAAGAQPAETSPVYRFWSDTRGHHFYTISETEKQKLIDNYSHIWTFEGVAWYAYAP